jgi:ABC-2 type transport system permease protein
MGVIYVTSRPAKENFGYVMVNTEILGPVAFLATLFLISITARIITQEYTLGTMKVLFAQRFSRLQIFLAKLSIVAIALIILQIAVFLTMLIVSFVFYGKNLIDFPHYFPLLLGNLLNQFFTVSAILLISNLVRNDLIAVIVGIVSQMGIMTVATILLKFIDKIPFVQYSPFSMFWNATQIGSPKILAISKLNQPEVLIGTLIYTFLFLFISYLLFERRDA